MQNWLHNYCIRKASFFHERNLCALLTDHFEQNSRHKSCIWKVSFLHKMNLSELLADHFEQIWRHKSCIWKASFLHELLIDHFEQIWHLKCCILEDFFKSWTESLWPFWAKLASTNVALERLLYFMNWWYFGSKVLVK